jgi:GNAT superfamily N-acetyltransferase
MELSAGLLIVGADHPSLTEAYHDFNAAIGELHALEDGPGSLPRSPGVLGAGFRLAAIYEGHIIGAARVDDSGAMRIAVLPKFRGKGVATNLSDACVARARLFGHRRLLLLNYAAVPHSA